LTVVVSLPKTVAKITRKMIGSTTVKKRLSRLRENASRSKRVWCRSRRAPVMCRG